MCPLHPPRRFWGSRLLCPVVLAGDPTRRGGWWRVAGGAAELRAAWPPSSQGPSPHGGALPRQPPVPGGAHRVHPGSRFQARPPSPWPRDPGRTCETGVSALAGQRSSPCVTVTTLHRVPPSQLKEAASLSGSSWLRRGRGVGAGGGQGPLHGVEGRGPCPGPIPDLVSGPATPAASPRRACRSPRHQRSVLQGCSSSPAFSGIPALPPPSASRPPQITNPWRGLLILHVGLLEPSETREPIPICVFQGGCPSSWRHPYPACPLPGIQQTQPKAMMILKLLSMALRASKGPACGQK